MSAVLTVCAPAAFHLPDPLPAGVEGVVWDGTAEAPSAAGDARVLVAGYADVQFDRDGLRQLPGLRLVQLLSAGYEDWLPAVPDGVTLANGRGVHGGSTAEMAIAGILAVVREIPLYVDQQRRGEWRPGARSELAGRRAVIVGAGDIGERVAATLAALDVDCTLVARTARDGVESIAELPGLAATADVLVLALPLSDDTRHLVDSELLARLPDGAVVANVARGAIVDTDALVEELMSRRLTAFLDVTDPEPLPPGHPLWSAPGALVTPHVGGGTERWADRARALVADQLERFRDGRPLRNVVER